MCTRGRTGLVRAIGTVARVVVDLIGFEDDLGVPNTGKGVWGFVEFVDWAIELQLASRNDTTRLIAVRRD